MFIDDADRDLCKAMGPLMSESADRNDAYYKI